MPSRTVTIASKIGLHARPAGLFAAEAAKAPVPVTIAKSGGDAVDARSLLSVLTLDIRGGDEVELTAEDGEGADAALDSLVALLEIDHDA